MYGNKHDKQFENNESDQDTPFDAFLRNGVTKVKDLLNLLSAHFSPKKFAAYLAIAALVLWIISGVYIVDEGNQGVVTRFGAYLESTAPGPHWHLPYPIESVSILNVAKQRYIEIGYNSLSEHGSGSILGESLMLTEDENIVDVRLAVQYQIKNARDYLFKVENQVATLKQATQSAERAVIGKNRMDFVLTEGRSDIVNQIRSQIQQIMDDYQAGIVITSVNLQDAQPPEQVQAAFEDAIKAREDKQRLINEAEAYANEIIPNARGSAARKIQEAEAYKENVIATASGDISRFNQLYAEYKKSPKVTRKRLLIETMEDVLDDSEVVMLDNAQGNNMLYLPIEKLREKSSAALKHNPVTASQDPDGINRIESNDTKFTRQARGRN